MLTTFGHFALKEGVIEMRAKMPGGGGLLPALWLLPQSQHWPPELDVIEVLGSDPTSAIMTLHWGATADEHQQEQFIVPTLDLSSDFHIFTLEWLTHAVIWSIDGQEVARASEHVPDQKMFLLLNLAIGGDWPGAPDNTVLPQALTVDYVRVFQRA